MTDRRTHATLRLGALTSCLALLSWTRPAPAQEEAGEGDRTRPTGEYRFDLGAVGGLHVFNESHGLGRAADSPNELSPATSGIFGLRFGVNFNRYFGFEAEALATRTLTRDETTSLWIFQLGGQFLIQPVKLGVVKPFLLLGYGGLSSIVEDPSILPEDEDGLARAGIGLKIGLGDPVGLRLEGRVLTPLAFASQLFTLGDETEFGGPDFQGLAALYINLGEIREKILVEEKVVMKAPPPDPDPDRDGVVGRSEKCPEVAEDKDGFEDEDGCPDADNDKDGVPDATDKCPLEPETKNDIDDEDGCPEKDTDNDGFIGSRDQCPNEPETKNGFKDNDGCPDEIPAEVRRFTGVIEGINFKTGSATLLRNSFGILDRAVRVLKDFPDIKLEIQGHTDSRGKPDKNRDLSQRRAESVRDYLIKSGIAAERLTAIGYGQDKPIASNRTAAGRSKNRRTEFQIVP